jgi:hypothetical protein
MLVRGDIAAAVATADAGAANHAGAANQEELVP